MKFEKTSSIVRWLQKRAPIIQLKIQGKGLFWLAMNYLGLQSQNYPYLTPNYMVKNQVIRACNNSIIVYRESETLPEYLIFVILGLLDSPATQASLVGQ